MDSVTAIKTYFWGLWMLVFIFKLEGYPELKIKMTPPTPTPAGVCTYLIWTVFISSGPAASGQLFTMRSSLDT